MTTGYEDGNGSYRYIIVTSGITVLRSTSITRTSKMISKCVYTQRPSKFFVTG
jgi:hypothetical protein